MPGIDPRHRCPATMRFTISSQTNDVSPEKKSGRNSRQSIVINRICSQYSLLYSSIWMSTLSSRRHDTVGSGVPFAAQKSETSEPSFTSVSVLVRSSLIEGGTKNNNSNNQMKNEADDYPFHQSYVRPASSICAAPWCERVPST